MVKTVVILGASYAGLHIAHYLLKQRYDDVKVIIVSKVRRYSM
jgi:NADH dehydrogenase FAD-containing subunit